MSVRVRAAVPEEYDGIAELTAEVYRDLRGSTLGEYEIELRDVARRASTAEVLVAVDDRGTLLGSVAFANFGSDYAEQAAPGEAVFRMLAVAPAARRRGAGEALVTACIDRARALGLHRLRLSTQAMMRDAHRLYERLGFVRTPADDWTVRPGVDLITYALDLVAAPIGGFCDRCGTASATGDHVACTRARELEPPRFCAQCGRRMTVQVTPTGWSAQCSEHGTTGG